MSMTITAPATQPTGDTPKLSHTAELLVGEIERYLAARVRTSAHPLVTKTTEELVAEALAEVAAGTPAALVAAPALRPPAKVLRRLPDWALSLPLVRAWHGGGRAITAAENLELVALVIETFGWTQDAQRDADGGRCILGAQWALHRLGYGDVHTLRAASGYLQNALGAQAGSYETWNDHPNRTRDQVLAFVRTAAAAARRDRR